MRDPFFGKPTKFSVNQLPTKVDVYKYYLHTRKNIPSSPKANPSVRDVSKLVVSDLINVWQRASIPIITKDFLIKRLIQLADELTSYCVISVIEA